jgi:AsmA protein
MKWTSGLLRLTPYRLKMLGVLFALLVLVFITALSVFYARFDPEQVRMQLADALQTDGRTLSIGQISPAVFPRPGIKIDQIRLMAAL